jgi:SAM-dependent methyltransferase
LPTTLIPDEAERKDCGMQMTGDVTAAQPGLLGDTVARDYGRKLRRFHAFAAPELRALIGGLELRPGMRVLDAGCGVGASLAWLADAVAPGGLALGFDLATAHVRAAHEAAPLALALQADLQHAPLRPGVFDLIWCTST